MTDTEHDHLQGRTTETVAYAPEEIQLNLTASPSSASVETLVVDSDLNSLQSDVPMMDAAAEAVHEHEEVPNGTLERLVKPDELAYEVPAEDKDVDDGQQPLGIVESCFPYLARRPSNQHHHRHHPAAAPAQKAPFTLGMCPGVRCYYGTTGFDEDHHVCTKERSSDAKQPDEFPLKTVG
ncbi:hypothetical protein BV898_02311 [Hypsibius exemplaris]|uniref:Uncharacterized protein n=1 Tax=Hypsibius exemplaris TaxID=2072580 RepID=A0A1W0X9A0_HYPEX|nr:hypothetical protein BV898_02311 [Hypsibius exemplaris]